MPRHRCGTLSRPLRICVAKLSHVSSRRCAAHGRSPPSGMQLCYSRGFSASDSQVAAAQNAILPILQYIRHTILLLVCGSLSTHCATVRPVAQLARCMRRCERTELNHVKCLPGHPCSRYCALQRSSVVAFALREGYSAAPRALRRANRPSHARACVPSRAWPCRASAAATARPRARPADADQCRLGWAVAANRSLRGVLGQSVRARPRRHAPTHVHGQRGTCAAVQLGGVLALSVTPSALLP
jgi:hypothetical protein